MTRIALVLGALMLAVAARADDFGRRRPDVDVFVPIPPEGHERLYWSDGRPHHLVPGTVSINGKPYVCDLDGRPIPGLTMQGANQEHGILAFAAQEEAAGDIAQRLPVGMLLRVLPNHACATAAQFPAYHVLQPSGGLLEWPRFGGW